MNLNAQQQQAVSKLERLKVGALFMEMRTGKTRTACELLRPLELDNVLWLAPCGSIPDLLPELERCEFRANVVGIESISQSDRIYLETRGLLNGRCAVVVDESIKIKNADSKRTKRAIELGKLAEFRLILNGTPLSRDLLDLWSQLQFLSPKILGMGLAQFKNTFCQYLKIKKFHGARTREFEMIERYHNLPYLWSLIDPYIVTADLQVDYTRQDITVPYQIDADAKKEYEELKEKTLNEYLHHVIQSFFIKMTQKMQHSYCVTADKLNTLKQMWAPDMLIVTKFVKSREAVQKLLPEATVLSYGTDAYGRDFSLFKRMAFFDKHYDYSKRLQMEARMKHLTKSGELIYYHFEGNVPLEKHIGNNILSKAEMVKIIKKL